MRLIPYRLPLHKPLALPGTAPIKFREGVLIHDPKTGGWGEAAPLPGLSQETLAQVLPALKSEERESCEFPSVRFAMEMLSRPFQPPPHPVKVNALWTLSTESAEECLRRLDAWDEPVVKVKPGLPPDPRPVREFLRQRSDARIRLDGNRQWTREDLRSILDSVPESQLDYIEEPFADPADYEQSDGLNFPLALDETLREPDGLRLAEVLTPAALVIKPTLMGNASDRALWMEFAARHSCRVALSSSVESGLGLWHLAALAAETGYEAAGLDTGHLLASDTVSPRPLPIHGQLEAGGQKLTVPIN